MNILSYVCIGIAVTALLAAAAVIILYRKNIDKTFKSFEYMIDTAINGNFSESVFDESLISALEAKLAQFLALCSASSTNLLAEKNKINELISDIAHQTKTPIANILLYSQLLSEFKLPEDGSTCVRALSAQAEKLHFLIHALMKTSRLETGIIKLNAKQEAVQKLLDTALAQIMPEAHAKAISVTAESSAALAWFDLKWTAEAIYNVLDNAVKYTRHNGTVSVSVTVFDLFCRIDITDNGIGIQEEEQSKIFSRFYRSPAVNTEEGVGIGLFLAREIIAAEGGYIKVSSQLNKGSTFSLFLPLEH
ncbi:HAMP domain-containing histidine kinase [Paenibacillus tritici]|uniref:histidine kinase n=1 Tax=Paenibacillus tritici TaxID=1873425 RepID=A0ABX2DUW8_9BACL|nr:HAMP domain-containing sensor histidine kinase [Paenibacillus tritici]NQX48480.1 HAMP domain-containing histidine kinase [Paenibacillus tritici]